MPDDLTQIRTALQYYHDYFYFCRLDADALQASEALTALDRLEGWVLPVLPDDWLLEEITCAEPVWFVCLRQFNTSRYVTGRGATLRAAGLAALAQAEA